MDYPMIPGWLPNLKEITTVEPGHGDLLKLTIIQVYS